jgi:hypothetical protein
MSGVGKKRSNRIQCSVAAGTAAGRRSQIWTIWSQRGTSDVYLKAIRGHDGKVSLHDPEKSQDSPPWIFGMTREYMEKHNDPKLFPHQKIVEWGPFGSYPPGIVPAVEVVFPESELRVAPDAPKVSPDDALWLDPVPVGQMAWFRVLFAPQQLPVVPSDADGEILWRHELRNGRTVILEGGVREVPPHVADDLEAQKARGAEPIYSDLARRGPEGRSGEGTQTLVGLHALRPEGTLLTILEFHALSYVLL